MAVASEREQATNLEGLLDTVQEAGDGADSVPIADIRDHLGNRSFGPLLLLPALVPLTPVSTVPGVPSVVGIMTILVASQMLIGAKSVWLPRAIVRRTVRREKIERLVAWLRPVARWTDRFIRPRLTALTRKPFSLVVALSCVLLGLSMLPLEVVPFTSGIPAFPVALLGLALTTRDGALVVVGLLAIPVSVLVFFWLGTTALEAAT